MTDRLPILLWFRRDLWLLDHPALHAAAGTGRPFIPVFLCDEAVEALGMGVAALAQGSEELGSRLVLRRGQAQGVLRVLAAETGAGAVCWTRLHDPRSRGHNEEVAEGLGADGLEARALPGYLLHQPEAVRTGAGDGFKVHAPFFRVVRALGPSEPLPAPGHLPAPASWPRSGRLEDWRLEAAMHRGGPVVAVWQRPGRASDSTTLSRKGSSVMQLPGTGLGRMAPRNCPRT